MSTILPKLRFAVKEHLLKSLRKCRDTKLRTRYLIIITLNEGRSVTEVAQAQKVHRDTVYRTAKRFRQHGAYGLLDRRADNGANKLNEPFLKNLDRLVRGGPQEYGHRRPTWTRELLRATLIQLGYVPVHVATLSRALRRIRARRARPRPKVNCPWPQARKTRRLNELRRLVATLPANEVAVYEDEVDIHLNPKIGYDWMGHGQQKEVLTPGKNSKRYLAGALDVRTRVVLWVEGEQKNSWLFVRLLGKLYLHYPQAPVIHVILDNYGIHTSGEVAWGLLEARGRIKLQFLPPYCPQHNKIERVWEDLHAEVTRNHTCPDMEALMLAVRLYLCHRSCQALGLDEEDHPPVQV